MAARALAAQRRVRDASDHTRTASVVGAIIGELPSGIRDGLGGAILNFNQYYISGPPKLWAAIVVASLVGIGFFLAVSAAEAAWLRGRSRPADA